MMPKGGRRFAGMVNFPSMVCPELQNYLNQYMTGKERVDSLYGEKSNKMHLKK